MKIIIPFILFFGIGSGVFSLSASADEVLKKKFIYQDASQRLPTDSNPAATDSLHVALADIDQDGDLDLFVSEGSALQEKRQNRLLINNGHGFFSDETALFQ